jgi:transposase InsO family protein
MKPHRRYTAEEKRQILETVELARQRSPIPLKSILQQIGLSRATYYRWRRRAQEQRLKDQVQSPGKRVPLPMPDEVTSVCTFSLRHPMMGYKRLTWRMVDVDVAYLRPYQVYDILKTHDLLARRAVQSHESLKRPPEPDHPDQVWHIDLMYVHIPPRWYYLVDILDGYSRYLVHWSLNWTMTSDTVTLTVQTALDRLARRRPGEPIIVHDRGSQFLAKEWCEFVKATGVTDIRTRLAHPQSNGRIERLHRTHRQEAVFEGALSDYYQALDLLEKWSHYYNHERPHTALRYLYPVDYYRGNPEARLAEREAKLAQAVEARRAYWKEMPGVETVQLSKNGAKYSLNKSTSLSHL